MCVLTSKGFLNHYPLSDNIRNIKKFDHATKYFNYYKNCLSSVQELMYFFIHRALFYLSSIPGQMYVLQVEALQIKNY